MNGDDLKKIIEKQKMYKACAKQRRYDVEQELQEEAINILLKEIEGEE